MPTFNGATVALLESRKIDELAQLVRRLGGVPICAPSVQEVPRIDDFDTFIGGLTGRRFSLVVFQTGAGATALLTEADRQGRLDEVVEMLRQVRVVCRGPKPLAVMKRFAIPAQFTTVKPHTTRELLDVLSPVDLQGVGMLVVHYGERNTALVDALRARGARLDEVCPYEWALPDDIAPMQALVRDTIEGRLQAVLFTNQIQCRHLFKIASDLSSAEPLAASLNGNIIVGAVGPVCADALRALGVTPDVMPAAPNMASLITAVADYLELTRRAPANMEGPLSNET